MVSVVLMLMVSRYNSLENPIGIETYDRLGRSSGTAMLQLIRKPDRD